MICNNEAFHSALAVVGAGRSMIPADPLLSDYLIACKGDILGLGTIYIEQNFMIIVWQ